MIIIVIVIVIVIVIIGVLDNRRQPRTKIKTLSLSHSCPSPHSTPQPADSLKLCRTNEMPVVEMIVFPPY